MAIFGHSKQSALGAVGASQHIWQAQRPWPSGMHLEMADAARKDGANPRLQRTVLDWLGHGLVWAIWIGFPCTWNSVAGSTKKRGGQAEQDYNTLLRFLIRVLRVCRRAGIFVVLENPLHSALWGPAFCPLARREV